MYTLFREGTYYLLLMLKVPASDIRYNTSNKRCLVQPIVNGDEHRCQNWRTVVIGRHCLHPPACHHSGCAGGWWLVAAPRNICT